MEVVRPEPSALALISAGSASRIILDRLARPVAAQEADSLTPNLPALIHHLGLRKRRALVLGVEGGSSEVQNQQQRAYLAPQIIQVPRSPPVACLVRPLKLDLVLPVVVLVVQRERGVLAVMHSKTNPIREVSHSAVQEHQTHLAPLQVVQIPPVVAVSLEVKLLLALEVNSNNRNKGPQTLSGHLARIRPKVRMVPALHSAHLAEIKHHQNQGGFSGLHLRALEESGEAYLPIFNPITHSNLKPEGFLEPIITVSREAVHFLGQSRRRRPEGDSLVLILQTRPVPVEVVFLIHRDLVPTTIIPRISKIKGVVFSLAAANSSLLNYSLAAVRRLEVDCSITI